MEMIGFKIRTLSGSLSDPIYDDGDRSVAGNVAGGSEAVHCNIKGNHQCLCFLIEAKH